jgi:translocation and assembly module TamB
VNNRRITWKRILAVLSVGLLFAGVGAIWFLHSSSFREWALQKVIQIAEERTGTRITVQGLELSLYPLAADLRGVTVRGTEATNENPLFRARNVRIGLRLVPLLRKDVQFERLILEKPEIAIRIDAGGQSNLHFASPRSASSSGAQRIAIRYAAVHDGLIRYGDKTVPLAAEIYRLEAELAATGTDRYRGRMQYDSGRVEAKDLRPIEHSLSATFHFDEQLCTVEQWQVKARNSEIHGHAQIANYQHPLITGQYDANVQGQDVRFIFNNTQVPAGSVQLQGNVRYTSTPGNSSVLEHMDVDGQFQSKALEVSATQSALKVERLRGKFTLEKGLLRIASIEGQALGGVLHSDNDVIDLVNNTASLQAHLRGAQLSQLGNPLEKGEQRIRLASTGTVDFAAHWKSGFVDPEYHVQSTLESASSRSLGPQDIPAEGTVDVTYESAHSRLVFADSHVKVGATELRLSGEMSRHSALIVDLKAEDLHSLVLLVSTIQPSEATQNPTFGNLRGAAEFSGRVTGALSDPRVVGRLTGRQLVLGETQWSSLQTSLVLDPTTLKLENLLLTSTQGQIRASMQLPLARWTPNRTAPLSVEAQLQSVSLATLQKTANTSYPLEGLLSGEARMTGSLDQPVGSGHIDLTRAVVYTEPLTEFHADFSAKGKSIVLNGNARGPAGALTARLSYDLRSQEYEVQGKTDNVDLAQINTLHAKTQDINGKISASISGKGTLDDPRMTAQIESADLNIRGEDFKPLSLRLKAESHRADLELKSRVEGADVSVKGHVELTGSYASDVMIDTGAVSIAPILNRYLSSQASAASGQLEIHARVSGPLKQPDQLEGQADVTNIHLVLAKNVELSNPRPMRLEYRAGVLEIKEAALKGNATDLNVSGSIPVRSGGELRAKAQGTVDLKALENLVPGGGSSGQVKVELQAQGTWQAPQMNGTIELANAAYTSDSVPVGLESMNGRISVHGRHVEIEHLTGLAGGGPLTIGGGADIGPAPAYAFTLTAQSSRVRQNGVRAQVDANLTLNGGKNKSTLAGQVMVRRLTFNQGSDLAEIAASFSGDDTLEEPSPLLEKINVDVAVRSDEQLALASSQLSIAGAANLRVTGNLARPILLGRIGLTSGEIFFLSKRFEIQNGTVVFANAARTNPVLNLSLNTTVEQYKITINLTGPLDKLRTTYTSDPSLPSADIINLLAFGQTTTQAASNASAPATLGAESAVANAVGSQVAGQLQKVTGISQLTIDPMAGNSQSSGAHVAIQQRVSGNLLVTFSTDITNAQSQAVQLKYQWKPNITVSILRDENGGYGLDVHYHKTF